jgi:hypothetical protein
MARERGTHCRRPECLTPLIAAITGFFICSIFRETPRCALFGSVERIFFGLNFLVELALDVRRLQTTTISYLRL